MHNSFRPTITAIPFSSPVSSISPAARPPCAPWSKVLLAHIAHILPFPLMCPKPAQVTSKKSKDRVRNTPTGDPYERHLTTFKTELCHGCPNVFECPNIHSCKDRRRPLTVDMMGQPNYIPSLCNDMKSVPEVRACVRAAFCCCCWCSVS